MKVAISDRILSILTYFTFGMAGLIWLVFAYVAKKQSTPYLMFNIFQSIFLSILLTVISLVYQIAINLISVIPFIGKLAVAFHIFFNQSPIFFGFTISGLLVTLLIVFLSMVCFIGKRPYIPFISETIKNNFGV